MAGKALLMLIAAAALLNIATATGPLIEHLNKTKDLTTVASVLSPLSDCCKRAGAAVYKANRSQYQIDTFCTY
jgi:hypothetical protein